MAAASAARHDTRALLRAHLAAASRYGHLTRHCVVCHRLLRLAMEMPEVPEAAQDPEVPEAGERPSPAEDEGPADP
ncbi:MULTISPECIES: DUF6274 family protein [unclassified Streptomyces]|uniref:DUF6274 family protein n=1 Tax=unclassified Streptomyces TaxID=2593676 RepID=UPI0006AE3EC0|nr:MULTISPECIES: DUF6274 family protein [unclassified Streptomyces]KOX18964.1 hypothetical protein ADL06_30215 [Streptomyces sp. NRRL F-6491]KOX37591.1 hypothetical protein ADL08_29460 [Streptomyces sp. NRRL F-6492]